MNGDVNIWIVVLLIISLALSGFFSSSESAFISLQRIRLRHLERTGARGIDRLKALVDRSERTLVTILIGNNLVNTASATLATLIAASFFGAEAAALISTVVITILLLIFGEITPKTIAIRHSERMALLYALPLGFFTRLFFPVAVLMEAITSAVASLAGEKKSDDLSQEEIRTVIMMGEESGVLREAETEMLRNVLKLEETEVSEIMMPRIEVVGVSADSTVDEIARVIASRGFTQMPVFENDLDSIIGVVHAKDALLRSSAGDSDTIAREIMREALFTPESKSIVALLNEMRARRTQMAIIIDEYGGTAGIVTLEDLIEEIVGEITSEYGVERRLIRSRTDDEIVVDAAISINDIDEILGTELPTDNADTVGGFIFEQLGHIPEAGESFAWERHTFHILSMRGQRVSMVRISRNEEFTPADESEANKEDSTDTDDT